MAVSLKNISRGFKNAAPRIILLGPDKVGKSTFGGQAPSPIFIPIVGETGLDRIESPKFDVAKTFADVLERIAFLGTETHDFRTVVIDSSTTLEALVWEETCRTCGEAGITKGKLGYGNGYVEACKPWREVTNALDWLREEKGMGCVLTGHVRPKTFNDPLADPYDTWLWSVQDRAATMLMAWADCTLFAIQKVFTRTVGESIDKTRKTVHAVGSDDRIMYTSKRPGHPGGNRYGLPYELPFSYASFQSAIDAIRTPAK